MKKFDTTKYPFLVSVKGNQRKEAEGLNSKSALQATQQGPSKGWMDSPLLSFLPLGRHIYRCTLGKELPKGEIKVCSLFAAIRSGKMTECSFMIHCL